MNNIAYCWTVSRDSGYIKLTVVSKPQTEQRLTAIFPYQLIIPSLVRSVILLALEQGWQPTKQGLK
ncbi:hypothetical protein WKK05_18065 [Nostoc sp. UHCC 0302]|uniref:hypothetical protein n=1 Tax=Nostoc sp. UHCC 0302 TaxID=3134896 RepID=UPI00311C9045